MSESKSESKSESNPESKSGAKSSAASVLDAVESFCTSSDLETEFENFAEAHADIFLAATEIPIGEEHPIEFHDVYMKYLSQFERRIESFIAKVASCCASFAISSLITSFSFRRGLRYVNFMPKRKQFWKAMKYT